MSVLNTLFWWQWIIIGAVPPAILLLYFLKLKRPPLEVPSTLLWSRAVADLHVNAPWQRLRRHPLLLLQLLLVILLMVALLRPGWQSTQATADRYVLLIDNSASMSATDQHPNRLAQAKQLALDIVDQMKAGHSAMVIAFSDRAQVIQTYTQSRRAVRRQIERIQPTAQATDIRDALRAAAGLANPALTRLEDDQAVDDAHPTTVYIFSDGAFPTVSDFALGHLEPRFVPIGERAPQNVGIMAFSTDRSPEHPQRMQTFCVLANFGNREAIVQLELLINDASADLIELTIGAGREKNWNFELPDLDEARLALVLHHQDALPTDNVAYLAVNRPQRARVLLVTSGNEPLRRALQTAPIQELAEVSQAAPGGLEDAQHRSQAATGAYDLVIYDGCRPVEMPSANTLFIGSLPPDGRWSWRPTEGPPTVIDVDRAHPLTQLLDMSYVKIAEGYALMPPTGSSALFESVMGPLFAVGPRAGMEDAVLGFSLQRAENGKTVPNTTWPLRPSFPVFVYNVARYLGASRGSWGVTSVRPGQSLTWRSSIAAEEMIVVTPTGQQRAVRRDAHDNFVYADTAAVGIYEVREAGGSISHRFAVNLFDAHESNLRPNQSVQFGHQTVAGTAARQLQRHELWRWILLSALALLAVEWYVYNRRG